MTGLDVLRSLAEVRGIAMRPIPSKILRDLTRLGLAQGVDEPVPVYSITTLGREVLAAMERQS